MSLSLSTQKESVGSPYPLGGVFAKDGSTFRVWAPTHSSVDVVISTQPDLQSPVVQKLKRDADGFHSGKVVGITSGSFYRYRLGKEELPDPASRFQPLGPHGPSQLIDSSHFKWTDSAWTGVPLRNQVFYEMHVGTFTAEGTWRAAIDRLSHLVDMGITALEIMPVADFPGRYGWGYDGVNLFAPSRLYGCPDDFRAFVDAAHAVGIGVILDVVYNHVGPDGNYLGSYSRDYFSTKYENEWGDPINFDGPNCGPVREFFVSNAEYWIREFHLDGLRLDATQQIFDDSEFHILTEISTRVREAGGGRATFLVAENEPQDVRMVTPQSDGGHGLDALWNDDFHHSAIVALTGKCEAYYTDYLGTPQEFVSLAKFGFLYQGQRYHWQKKPRGTPTRGVDFARFVTFIQNHDQIANSLRGQRVHAISHPGMLRAMTALLLLGPGTPMIFQGQEFASSSPFLYFADHNADLAQMVREGRRDFMSQFPSLARVDAALPDPEQESTFQRCKLDFDDVEKNHEIYDLHRSLIALRRSDPMINGDQRESIDGAVLFKESFVLRYFGESDRLLVVNFGRQYRLEPMPQPLLAPPAGCHWKSIWCSEEVRFGGDGVLPFESDSNWLIPARMTMLLTSESLPVQ